MPISVWRLDPEEENVKTAKTVQNKPMFMKNKRKKMK